MSPSSDLEPAPAPSEPAPPAPAGRLGRLLARLRSPQVRNTATYFGVSVLSKAVSILLVPLYTARLTRAEYGLLGLAQTLYWIGPPLFTGALISAFSRFYFDHKAPADRDRAVGSLGLGITALALTAGLAFELLRAAYPALHLKSLGAGHLRLVVWTCVALAIGEIATVYLRAAERAGQYAAVHLGVFAVTTATTIYLLVGRRLGITAPLVGMLAGQGVAAAVGIGFLVLRLKPALARPQLGPALAYSIPFIPHLVGNSLMAATDRWLLEHHGLHDELGLYTLAVQLALPIQLATAAWNEASSPRFLATWRDGGYRAAQRALPKVVAGFLACSVGMLLLLVASFPVLKLLVGERFRAAFPLIPWVGLTLVVGTLFSAFVNVLFLKKATRLIPVLTLSSLAVNAALNYVLIGRYGLAGAILGTGIAQGVRTALMAVFALVILRRELRREAATTPG